ncbi:thermonuclease family protein [Kutzneria kofuensis]|uniref:thermonuclease family protein n=1 Tax=Kutzneria kofuensis TaxID=103725 RepID=UPI0031EF8CA2
MSAPGVFRAWWWRSSQAQRLALTSVATVAGLALSGAALLWPRGMPAFLDGVSSFADSPASSTTTTADIAMPVVTPTPDDPVITVKAVSTAARFDGVDATGRPVAIRVSGIVSAAGCWSTESVRQASEALLDKRVWLVHATIAHPDPDGRVPAQVLLPDGHDYALTMLRAGAVRVGTGPEQGKLTAAEADARQARRGLWGSSCTPASSEGSTAGQPVQTTSATGPTTTTSAVDPTVTAHPTTSTDLPTTTHSGQQGGQSDVQVGQPCSPEGASGVTSQGQAVTCVQGMDGQTRWRKS